MPREVWATGYVTTHGGPAQARLEWLFLGRALGNSVCCYKLVNHTNWSDLAIKNKGQEDKQC